MSHQFTVHYGNERKQVLHSYTVQAEDERQARVIADRLARQECPGHPFQCVVGGAQ